MAHLFEELGAFIVDADKLAHESLLAGTPVYEEITLFFKNIFLQDTKDIDHKKLAAVVFEDAEKKKKLESIIHPYVFKRILEEIGSTENPLVIVEVPLLYETGYDRLCYKVIVVSTEEALINKRLKEKGFSLKEIQERRASQMPLKEKINKASVVIDNSGTFQKTRNEVEEIWKQLHLLLKGDRKQP